MNVFNQKFFLKRFHFMKVILEKYFETIRKLFFEIGIKSINMDDICNELGISKKTLYKEYANKKELVTDVFNKDFYDFKIKLISAQKNCPDAIDQTCIIFKLIAEKQNSLSLASLYDLRKYYHQLFDDIAGMMNYLILETISSTLNRGVAEKNFREDIEPDKIAAIVSFIFESAMMRPITNLTNNSVSWSDNNFLDYHFKSICKQEGLELWHKEKANIK